MTDIQKQLPGFRLALVVSVVVAILVIIIGVVLPNTELEMVMDEVIDVAELPIYTGALQVLATIIWCACSAVCIFTGIVLSRAKQPSRDVWLWLSAGLFLLWITVDDTFRIHEKFFVDVGISETYTMSMYAIALFAFLYIYHKDLLETSYSIAFVSICFLGASVLIDLGGRYVLPILANDLKVNFIFEDGTKLIGATLLLLYFLYSASEQVILVLRNTGDNAAELAMQSSSEE